MARGLKTAVIVLAAILVTGDSKGQELGPYQLGYEAGYRAGHVATCRKTELLPLVIRLHLERQGICP